MRHRPLTIAILLTLCVGWLAACQAPVRVDDPDGGQARPANDDFVARVVLEGPAGIAAGSSVDATAEDGEPAHAG